jgi:hypothetical protein
MYRYTTGALTYWSSPATPMSFQFGHGKSCWP